MPVSMERTHPFLERLQQLLTAVLQKSQQRPPQRPRMELQSDSQGDLAAARFPGNEPPFDGHPAERGIIAGDEDMPATLQPGRGAKPDGERSEPQLLLHLQPVGLRSQDAHSRPAGQKFGIALDVGHHGENPVTGVRENPRFPVLHFRFFS